MINDQSPVTVVPNSLASAETSEVATKRQHSPNPWRVAGFILLTFGSLRVPLPQADFHNVRHHDAPGEICVFHDHLLRWHPSADQAANVAILHWHWFLPLEQPEHDDQHNPSTGPSLHAQFGDWSGPDWRTDPGLEPDSQGRLLERLTLSLQASNPHCLGQLPPCVSLSSSTSSAMIAALNPERSCARITFLERCNC